MICTFIAEACSDLPVATCCRVMKVSTSAYYSWLAQPVSDRDWADAQLTNIIVDIHRMSRHSYGSPRVHAELRLGAGIRCSRKRVERLMRQADVQGIHRRKGRGCTRRAPDAEPSDDLVNRAFDPTEPDRLWVMDVTEHPTAQGKVFLAVVLDAFSRRVVGWSIADHVRSELVVDAVQMAIWRRCPPAGQTVAHSDHGSQDRLHKESGAQRWAAARFFFGFELGRRRSVIEETARAKSVYLALPPRSCRFVYQVARSIGARRIVEFGTSFGVSTIYLAAAVRDNGGCRCNNGFGAGPTGRSLMTPSSRRGRDERSVPLRAALPAREGASGGRREVSDEHLSVSRARLGGHLEHLGVDETAVGISCGVHGRRNGEEGR